LLQSRRERLLVLLILVLAAMLRLYWVAREIPILQGEECEYTRLAQNLVRSQTYVGMLEGPQLMYPPFFASLLGAGYLITGNFGAAAHAVPLAAGLALVLAVFALARLHYGPRVGLIAATLAACHPLLIALSGAALSESVYLPLVVGGIYFGLRCLDAGRRTAAVSCGVCFGLAYLTRPESLSYPFFIVAAVLLVGRAHGVKKALVTALLVLVPVVALAAPYVAYLSIHSGGFRLEGKSAMNYTIGLRRNAGMSYPEAALGLGTDLREDGPQLSANHFVATARYGIPFRDIIPYWLGSAHRNMDEMFTSLVRSPAFGSLFTLMLVTIGLLRRPWSRRRLIREAVLLVIGLGIVVTLLGAHGIQLRYVMPLLPFLIIWGAKGIDETARWLVATAQRFTRGGFRPALYLGTAARCTLILVLLLISMRGLSWGGFRDENPERLSLKQAGIWLDQYKPGPKRIMSIRIEVPYYARGSLLPFPYAPGAQVLEYVHVKGPDFLVLTSAPASVGPYIQEWFEHGIPDSAAHLIYRTGGSGDYDVVIYEWTEDRG
jgi:4-amino-4-deoxy-L-arabinose transferase-like glycosyltransferase